MRDPVTKRVEMALVRYNPQITRMEVQTRPHCRPRQSGAERDAEEWEVGLQFEAGWFARLVSCSLAHQFAASLALSNHY